MSARSPSRTPTKGKGSNNGDPDAEQVPSAPLLVSRTPSSEGVGVEEGPPQQTPAATLAACVVLLGMIASWIAMSLLLQNLQDGFQKPCFITWFVHSGYTLFVVFWLPLYVMGVRAGQTRSVFRRYDTNPCRLLVCVVGATMLAFTCAYMWYLSLTRTTVASNNSIYQSSTAVVYLMSVLVLKERVTWLKSLSVVVSIGGVVMVSVAPQHTDASDTHATPIGYLWLMVSVFAYAGYEVFQKRYMEPRHAVATTVVVDEVALAVERREQRRPASAFIDMYSPSEGATQRTALSPPSKTRDWGAVEEVLSCPDLTTNLGKCELATFFLMLYGVCTACLCWLVLVVVHAAHIEDFEAPPKDKLGLLCLNAALDSLYNGLLLFGIFVASPLFMSVGCMLVMPASIVVDRITNGTRLAPLAVVGALCIVFAFAMLNVSAFRKGGGETGPSGSSGRVHMTGPGDPEGGDGGGDDGQRASGSP